MKWIPSKHLLTPLYFLGVLLLIWLLFTFLYQYFVAIGSLKALLESMLDKRLLSALYLSLLSSLVTLLFSIFFGIPLAYLFATKKFRGKSLCETLTIDVPQTFPPVAEGMIYLLLLGPSSPIHLNLAYTFSALVIAKVYVSAPFLVSFTLRRFNQIHESGLPLTARTLGANPFQVFAMIFLPLSIKEISAGTSLCWARAMGELGASLIFAGVIPFKTEIIPNYIIMEASTLTTSALAATILITTASLIAIVTFKLITKRAIE
jgi:ABC-type sulfate transport system permease component